VGTLLQYVADFNQLISFHPLAPTNDTSRTENAALIGAAFETVKLQRKVFFYLCAPDIRPGIPQVGGLSKPDSIRLRILGGDKVPPEEFRIKARLQIPSAVSLKSFSNLASCASALS
jgi:hypothetical protein